MKKEMDPIIRFLIFLLMVVGVPADNILIRVLVCTIILCAATVEWSRLTAEERQYRKDCEV
jgi:hypothetical protein